MVAVPGLSPLDEDDPTTLGPYVLLGRLGDGGMGSVYLGRLAADPSGTDWSGEQSLVAIKVIRADLARIDEFRARFEREARAAQRVARFCTAEVIDVNADGRRPYLVTEYVDGPTLSAAVRERGPLRPAAIERLAVAVANALTAIHAAGVVHRDLKPGNIILSSSGARVIDFGIARALDATTAFTQSVIGTPAFMAPEQALGEPVAEPADVHAWGAVVLFAATGRSPFGDGSIPVLLQRVATAAPDLTALPGSLRPMVTRAMAKDPAERPSARDLLLALVEAGPTEPRNVPAGGDARHSASTDRRPGPPRDELGATRAVDVDDSTPTATALTRLANGDARTPVPAPAPTVPTRGRRRGLTARGWIATAVALALAAATTVVVTYSLGKDGPEKKTTASILTVTPPQPLGGPLTGHTGFVWSVAFFPDSKKLATASTGGAIRIWDIGDPRKPRLLSGPLTNSTDSSVSMALSPDGKTLAATTATIEPNPDPDGYSYYRDRGVHFWNVTDPARPAFLGTPITSGDQQTISLAFSPDGTLLASGRGKGNTNGGSSLWNVMDPAEPKQLGPDLAIQTNILSVAFSPDGKTLATGGGGARLVYLWDITDRSQPRELGKPLTAVHLGSLPVVFSPDGSLLATGGLEGNVYLWDVTDRDRPFRVGRPLLHQVSDAPDRGAYSEVKSIAFTPDGSVLATVGPDGNLRLWDVTDARDPKPLGAPIRAGTGNVLAVAISPDGTILATAGDDATVRLWRLR